MVALQKSTGLVLFLAQFMGVYSMNLDNKDGIVKASKALASDLISFYHGNESGHTPGLLLLKQEGSDGGYWWYESGAFMGSYIDYWQLTGDKTYNDLVTEGIQWQVGKGKDFIPTNQSASLGNDDQSIWALGALTAAEYGFPDPPKTQPQWFDLAVAVWEEQRERWDTEVKKDTCDGGLRWQIMSFNNGYNYKSTFANALFFNIGARLAKMTANETYADYAAKTWDWLEGEEFIDNQTWAVYDGASTTANCTNINKLQFSANPASLAMGAAFMYNFTEGSDKWRQRTEDVTSAILKTFFTKNGDFKEVSCSRGTCPPGTAMYKGFVHRWLAVSTQVAPFTASAILPVLRKSAEGLKTEGNGNSMEQTFNNFVVVSNLLIADSSAPGTHNETQADKTKDDPASTSGSDAKASSTKPAGNSAIRLAGAGSFLTLSMLVMAFQWIL